jgi:putative hydrolase of the HAD superfamily
METIEAVIFDWGGVLIEDPAPAIYSYCAEALDVPIDEYLKAHLTFEADFIKGLINEEQFWERLCHNLSREKPKVVSLWSLAFEKAYRPRQEMFNLAVELDENGYKIAILSNTEMPAVRFFYKQGLDRLFDTVIFSCVEKLRKPERKIYDLTATRLGVKSFQCVFIDDKIEYIEAAKQAGMKGILFKGIELTKSELESLGVRTI